MILKRYLKSINFLASFILVIFCISGSSVYGAEDKSKDMKNVYKLLQEKKFSKNKIFYLIGEPYYIEGVKYVPEENYFYQESS